MAAALTLGATAPHAAALPVHPVASTTSEAATFAATETWAQQIGGTIAESSPTLVTIGGVRAAVVGTRSGQVYAFSLATGRVLPGWPVTVPGGVPVDSTPSTLGGLIFVSTGNAADPHGGYLALRGNGSIAWYRTISVGPNGTGGNAGVMASMAAGFINGRETVVAGSLGEQADAFNAYTGATRPGFPWFSSDTEFSTPAIANLYGNRRNEIIGGAEQTAGLAYEHHYAQGGHLRVLAGTGNAGAATPAGGTVCDFTPNQGVYSSPAVGRFLSGNRVGITVGASTDFPGASDSDALFGLTTHCGLVWQANLNGATQSSPALVDGLGNGHLQVAEGTENGVVYLLDGANGRPYWVSQVGAAVIGGVTSADLGGGHQDLLVPTTRGLWILDGRSGRTLDVLAYNVLGMQSSPLVTAEADGHIGITLAGYDVQGGLVMHFDLSGTAGWRATEAGSWPEFHHDPQLTGSTLPVYRR